MTEPEKPKDKYTLTVVKAEYSYVEIDVESDNIEDAHNQAMKKAEEVSFPESLEKDYSVRTIIKNGRPLIY
jgi:hypothetical protein